MTTNVYFCAKALHLIGMVSWMAGLFYLVRIMVYHAMAADRPAAEKSVLQQQYVVMEWKAYKIILQPAVVITWTFGSVMLSIQPEWFSQSWIHWKLVFLLVLTVYTHYLKGQIRALEAGTSRVTHLQFRALNEVPTIIMVGIIFLAVFRDRINYVTLVAGLTIFIGLIAWGIRRANR